MTFIKNKIYITLFLTTLMTSVLNIQLYAQNILRENHPIQQEVDKIYQKLLEANGDYRMQLPKLVIMDRKAKVASYRSSSNQLILELEAYQLCKSMGKKSDAALAFLIGHELTHFYQKHDWKELGFAGTDFFPSKTTFAKKRQNEEEADVYGAFVAYLAGYKNLDFLPELLEKIYDSYALTDNLDNYPALKERKAVAQKVELKLEELIEVYESSNYFMALGWHIQAVYGYDHILKFVRTKELYNNLGTAFLAIAIQQRRANAYWYPIELDMDHALRNLAFKTETELLDLARENLLRAVDLDSSYASAWINLTAVYDLMGEEKKARFSLAKADLHKTTLLGNAKVLLLQAVLDARAGKKPAAKAAFLKAKSYTLNSAVRSIANHNLDILEKGYSRLKAEPMSEINDILDGLPLLDGPPRQFNEEISLKEESFGQAALKLRKLTNSQLACFELPNPQNLQKARFVLHRSRSLQTSKKIRRGHAVGLLRKAYKQAAPPQAIQHKSGYFLIYRDLGLIFKLNEQEKIEEWAVFLTY